MVDGQGPTVRRRIVASELRRLRAEATVRQHIVAEAVGIEQSALSRYEQAKSSMTIPVAEKLLDYYGVTGDHRGALLEIVRGSRKRGRLANIKGRIWEPLVDLVALERDASVVQEMAIQVIPGLLQTESYASAILSTGLLGPEVDQHVQARLARVEILMGDAPIDYWIIIREPALRCAVGGKPVMRKQLMHLIEMAAQPNITLQVLPDAAGEHVAMSTPFSILRFTMAPNYGVVYLDYHTGSLYLDHPDEVAVYDRAYQHLVKAALSREDSVRFITGIMEELFK